MNGRVEALCSSNKKGVPKNEKPGARFEINVGMVGDAHAGPGHRQVSLLGAGDVGEFKRQSGLPLAAGAFAENVLVSGIDLRSLGLGSRLRLGEDVVLTITQRGKICHDRCAIYFHAGDCIMPRRGLFARVLTGGNVTVNDPAFIEHLVPRSLAQVVVITISDRCSRGEAEDTAGPAVAEALVASRFAHVYTRETIADDRNGIAARMRHYCDGHSIDLVVAVGGTGFAPRDVTPEAVRDVVDRLAPGLDEAMRAASQARTVQAMLSRATLGIRHSTLVVSLPGSRHAAVQNLEAILPALEHGLAKLRGDPSDCGRPATPKRGPGKTRQGRGVSENDSPLIPGLGCQIRSRPCQFYKLEGNPFIIEDINPAKRAKIIEQAVVGILKALKRDGDGAV